MTAILEGLEAVTIHITDVRRSRKFYRDVLGLKELLYDEKSARAAYEIPGSTTQLRMHIQAEGEGGRAPGTVSGIVFTSRDPAAAAEKIIVAGGMITDEPHTIHPPGFSTTMTVFADPDGNEFVLRSLPKPTP